MYKIIVAIEILILILIWPFLVLPSIMIFDAPNSTSLIFPWMFAGSVWSYPLLTLVGLGFAYRKRKSSNTSRKLILLSLIPTLVFVLLIAVMIFTEWWNAPR